MIQYFTNIIDLEPLEDVLDILIFDEEPSIFSEENTIDFVETIFQLIDDFLLDNPNIISEPDFHDILLDEIKELFSTQMEDHILQSDYVEDDMNEIIEDTLHLYMITFDIERSCQSFNNDMDEPEEMNNVLEDTNNETNEATITNMSLELNIDKDEANQIEKKIQALREIPQPVQRSPEWYKFRWNLITASNAWKAFEGQAVVNQLIYEKCQPLKEDLLEDEKGDEIISDVKMVNTNSPLHWGQKYEPLSVMIYEHMYSSKIEDFGCIQHPKYSFLGASPDGIVIESNSGRYGYMIEIKNPVSREITGIPKKEYWVQMQLQMEVCDLDKCDFLETKFVEYPSYESYRGDSSSACFQGNEFNSYVTAADGSYKGIMIYFHTKEGKPFYAYMPLNVWTPEDVSRWEDSTIHKYESEPFNYTFMKYIYWKLEKFSCVLVLRNKEWFKNNIKQLEKVWKTIEEERVTGYEHRAPKRNTKKDQPPIKSFFKPTNNTSDEVCFLKVIKMGNET